MTRYWLGKKFSEVHKKRLSAAAKKRTGEKNGFFGKMHSKETKAKMSAIKIGKYIEEKSPIWKGQDVGYHGLHHWLTGKYGKANRCENIDCHYPKKNKRGALLKYAKRFEWANLSHKYFRNKKDFIQLCASCHRKWDSKLITISINPNNSYAKKALEKWEKV